MDMSQYLDVFLEESKEHLENLNQKLLQLEKNHDDMSALNEIFRAAHTLKGMSSTMGFEDLADLTHHMENVLSDLKEGKLEISTPIVDVLFQCLDRIQTIIEQIETTGSGVSDNSDLIAVLDNVKTGALEAAAVAYESEHTDQLMIDDIKSANTDKNMDFSFNEYDITVFKEAKSKGMKIFYVKVGIAPECLMKSVRAFMVFKALEEEGEIIKSNPPAQELDEGKFEDSFEIFLVTSANKEQIVNNINNISEVTVLNIEDIEIEAIVSSNEKPVFNEKVSSVSANIEQKANNVEDKKKSHKVKQTVRVDIERLDNLMNLVGELVMHKGRLEQIGATTKMVELNETIEQIDRITADLQSVVMKVRMVPIEQVFNRFPRMVRDLAKELNKEVEFLMEGKETELDRTVIDEIGDPLVHLLRNAVDHGLEPAEERIKKGKPAAGTLMLRARHEGNNVYIEVEDDGAGINVEKVKKKAVEKGLITEKETEKMDKDEAIELLFYPGFSTASVVSDISGRGVGLDVVKTKIEALNGEIAVDSKPDKGTRFKIKLPLTLAIIQALMVAVRDEIYAIPLSSVDETTMISKNDIKIVQGQEVIMLRGNVLPIFRLAEILETPGGALNDEEMYVVVVRKADRQIGLVVDTLIGQQEIVIKSLGKLLSGIPGIAGAIVAGDGNVRLILDVATLF
ncbi:MAG: chemotaxis protein CheA [Thermosyntropha sp.]|nr:chemotaxis protein CheA [Thermosyntropha sp.]MBO8159371.1 chemotaxis protein CheA [Thermosyntropha sp.]